MAEQLWFIFALSAAVLWGIGYIATEKLLQYDVSPAFMILVQNALTFPIALFISMRFGNIKEQIALFSGNMPVIALSLLMALCIIGGELLIIYSIDEKNATLTSLVEISYPIFTFIFAWIFLKEVQLTWEQAIGGVFIFIGIGIIFLKS